MKRLHPTSEEDDLVLGLGDRAVLSGTLGEWTTVIDKRPARHGWWYTFRSDDGHLVEGYAGGFVTEYKRAETA